MGSLLKFCGTLAAMPLDYYNTWDLFEKHA